MESIHEKRLELPLMAYRSYGEWQVWKRGKDLLLTPGVLNKNLGVGEGRWRQEDISDSGGIRSTFREDWVYDEVGGDGGEITGDTARSGVIIWCF